MFRNHCGRMGRLFLVVTFLALSPFGRQALSADPFDSSWSLRTSVSQGNTNNLKAATYANGLYVAVGDNSTVVTSTDQVDWKTHTLVSPGGSTDPKLYAVTYGNNLWVAVGSYIWTSPDGATWTYRGNPSIGPFYAVAYGTNGRYVAAGGTGGYFDKTCSGAVVVATSEDGITWTDRSSTSGFDTAPPGAVCSPNTCPQTNSNCNWEKGEPTKALIFADGKFVQLAWHQPPYYSTDGLTFTPANVPGDTATIPGYNHAVGMAYGNGTFLTVDSFLNDNYGGTIMTSTDGVTWKKTTGPHFSQLAEDGSDFSLATNLSFGNGVFLGLEEDSSSNGPYNTYTSPDAVTWTAHPISNAWGNAIASSPAGFTLVYNGGAIYTTADDGVTWKPTSSATISATATAWGNNMYVIVGTGGSIYTSPDGTNWTSRSTAPLASKNFKSVVYGKNGFVAVGSDANSGAPSEATSVDGVTWLAQTEPSLSPSTAVASGNGTYVGIGGSTVYSSTDGVAWTKRASDPAAAALNAATFGNGTFMVVGDSTIMTSPDGVTWTPQSSGVSYRLVGVAAGNNLFAAAGDNGTIRVSANGTSWSAAASGISGALSGMAFGAGRFVAIGGQGFVGYSTDGRTWTARSLGPYGNTGSTWAIAYGNEKTLSDGNIYGTFVAVSANTILQSNPVPLPLAPTPAPDPATPASTPADPPAASGGGGGGGCFIATAAYGSDFAWQVRTFKAFRDRYLLTCQIGRMAVRLYYTVSPPMAAFIAGRPVLRSVIRLFLNPMAYAIRYPLQSAVFSVLCLSFFAMLKRLDDRLMG